MKRLVGICELLRPYARIWRLTWPILAAGALEPAVALADLWMVRPYGPAATAAVGIARQVTFLVDAISVAITAGILVLVSQSVGASARRAKRDDGQGTVQAAPAAGAELATTTTPIDAVSRIVNQGIGLVLVASMLVAVAGYALSGRLFALVSASDEIRALGVPYLQICFAGLAFTWLNLVAATLYRGAGDVATPLAVALGASLLQVVLDYLLIRGVGPLPPLSVQGAAVGAMIARATSAAVYLSLLAHGAGPLRLTWPAQPLVDWPLVRRMIHIGAPMAWANVLRYGSRVVFVAIVGASSLGASLPAAVTLALQLRQLGILAALAFQTATATLVGQALGRGELREAEAIAWRSIRLVAALMAVVTACVIAFAMPLADLFFEAREAASTAAKVFGWFAIAQFFSALSIATQGALMGAGDTQPAMRYTLLSEWCLLLPASYLLAKHQAPAIALLATWAICPALTFVLMQWRLTSGRWKPAEHEPAAIAPPPGAAP